MARCGWCLDRRHDECVGPWLPCGCGCEMKTGFWYAEETGRYCWRCPTCLFGRGRDTYDESFVLAFQHECRGRTRMETPIKSGAQRCWDYLDGVVDRITTLNAELADAQARFAAVAAGQAPPEVAKQARAGLEIRDDLLAAQNTARGAAAVLSIIYALRPETISAESGARAQARAAGQVRPYCTDAELRGMWEPAR